MQQVETVEGDDGEEEDGGSAGGDASVGEAVNDDVEVEVEVEVPDAWDSDEARPCKTTGFCSP